MLLNHCVFGLVTTLCNADVFQVDFGATNKHSIEDGSRSSNCIVAWTTKRKKDGKIDDFSWCIKFTAHNSIVCDKSITSQIHVSSCLWRLVSLFLPSYHSKQSCNFRQIQVYKHDPQTKNCRRIKLKPQNCNKHGPERKKNEAESKLVEVELMKAMTTSRRIPNKIFVHI